MPAAPRQRKAPPRLETAGRILAAAEESFAAHGLAGARTERIAAHAGVNKAMLYYYFGSKQNLYRAVLRHLLDQLGHMAAPGQPAPASPRERLVAFVEGYFDFLASHPNYLRLIQREVMESKGEIDWIMREYYRPLLDRLIGLIESGIRRGELRRVDPQQAAFSIMGTTASYFAAATIWSRYFGRPLLGPAALETRREALLDFVGYGLFRPARRPS
ncbi:MAG TPA: TetR/AcrR family transcriptional regulator [Candidatus Dormibacteraeota bacterium]|nr:TetR/AcrR family transcriptional regulator [Candidatus Dormibacteraeota bacterium]